MYKRQPQCIEHEIPVILDDKVKKEYAQFERDLLLQIDENTITAQSAGVLTGKLLQFCSGAIYDNDRKVDVYKRQVMKSVPKQYL